MLSNNVQSGDGVFAGVLIKILDMHESPLDASNGSVFKD